MEGYGYGHESKKGFWSAEEDSVLKDYLKKHGTRRLKRSGKNCILRWMNYLSPNVKRGDFSEEEQDFVVRLHNILGNRIPGRTDNQVKNFWNTHLIKKFSVNKKKKSKVCAPPKYIPMGSTGDSLEFIGEGEKLVHESSSGDLIDFASMYERIVTDDFGCTFSFANSVFDLFRSVFLAFDRVVCKTF
ncbi:hypothetical protein AAZX31_05G035700 [Glycine max]